MIELLLRRLRARDDRGSLPMALLISILCVTVGVIVVPTVIVQAQSTSFDNSRTRELNAAEAGIDVALGVIRNAVDTSGAGIVGSLPCATTSAPITGTVAGAAAGLSYSVTLDYYTSNPQGQSAQWLSTYSTSNPNGNGMICAAGNGTYFPPTKAQVPSFVMISSKGMDGRASRTLKTTYVVQTSNINPVGGTIYVYPSGSTKYCMDAGSARPVAGASVTLQTCQTNPTIQQQSWSYNTDLSVELNSSVSSAYPNGLCLTSSNTTTQSAGNTMVLQPCSAVGSAPWYQKWSVDDSAHLEGSKSDSSDLNGLCINASTQAAGTVLALAACAGGVTDTKQTWVPSPLVGAGMAGAANHQLVDYWQYGRCIDVTNQSVATSGAAGGVFLIAYTCKQNPNPGKVAWNQKFAPNSSGELVTVYSGTNYCLTSPLAVYNAATPGPYVTVTKCPNSPTPAVTWTQYGATDTSGNALPYSKKYTIQDANGMCMTLPNSTTDLYNGQYSKLIMATCSSDFPTYELQEWNASPDLQSPALTNLNEVSSN
jgi:hypothetical protein